MTKRELMTIAKRYDMEIIRDPITHEAWGVAATSDALIPELDAYCDGTGDSILPCSAERIYQGSGYLYRFSAPTDWFTRSGWRVDNRIAWDPEHTTQIKLKLNNKTDADILQHLAKQPNKQGYIKALIRLDMQ